jgi:flavin reductase (DIM6/NTAB) family NADH-FMN oxidoreductase RutF
MNRRKIARPVPFRLAAMIAGTERTPSSPPPVEPAVLRRTLRSLITGVTVVTTFDAEGKPRGFTANSFTSVSLEPPLVLVCIAHRAGSFPAFRAARHFAINILSESQAEISQRFASPLPDKFAGIECRDETDKAPLIAGSLAWLDCHRHDAVEAGDHLILIGEVTRLGHQDARPLGYCGGDYLRFDSLRPASPAGARAPAASSFTPDARHGGRNP